MKPLRQALSVAVYNFRQWRRNPRIFLSFALAFILCFLLSNKVVAFAEGYGTSMQFLEPFIWTFGDSDSILLSSLLLVFLFADMPFLSSGTPFYLMRTTRRIWLIGQAIYILLATLGYLAFVLLSTCLICAEHSFPGNLWSETAAMLGHSGAGEAIAIPATLKAMEMATPYRCALTIFALILLYTLLMVFLMLAFNLWKGQLAGMVAVLGFSLYGFLLSPEVVKLVLGLNEMEAYKANVVVGWLSPLNQATFPMHNFGYDLLPRLWQTYVLFAVLILLCFGCALRIVRRYNFAFTGTEGGS